MGAILAYIGFMILLGVVVIVTVRSSKHRPGLRTVAAIVAVVAALVGFWILAEFVMRA